MIEVVINSDFGGFGLSDLAIERYAELKGIKLYRWTEPRIGFTHYTTVPQDEYKRIENEERQKPIKPGRFEKSSAVYFSDSDIPRTDPVLIQVVKELKQKANGRFAKLKVIKIPSDIKWEITEYDGLEKVEEKHRSWG